MLLFLLTPSLLEAQEQLNASAWREADVVALPRAHLSLGGATTTTAAVAFSPACFAGNFTPRITVGDFDGDGRLDLARCVNFDHFVQIYLNTGNSAAPLGPFSSLNATHDPFDIVARDLDNDGVLDLAVANFSASNTVSVFEGKGDGTFKSMRGFGAGNTPIGIDAGDVDKDGRLDLVVANRDEAEIAILYGTGQGGAFKSPVHHATGFLTPNSVAVRDFNADGNLDVAAACGGAGISVFLGNGDGSFQPRSDIPVFLTVFSSCCSGSIVTRQGPRDIVSGDFNADGKLDLALTLANQFLGFGTFWLPPTTAAAILLGNGDGTFGSPSLYLTGAGTDRSRELDIGDLNGDGILDLATINQASSTITVLLGNGDGTFGNRVDFPSGGVNVIAIADMNGDGRADLIDDNCVFINAGPSSSISTARAGREGATEEAFTAGLVPNPLRHRGELSFVVPSAGSVSVKLYNVTGQLVRTVWTAEAVAAGRHRVGINRRDERGGTLVSGVYFYRIESRGGVAAGRFVIVD